MIEDDGRRGWRCPFPRGCGNVKNGVGTDRCATIVGGDSTFVASGAAHLGIVVDLEALRALRSGPDVFFEVRLS